MEKSLWLTAPGLFLAAIGGLYMFGALNFYTFTIAAATIFFALSKDVNMMKKWLVTAQRDEARAVFSSLGWKFLTIVSIYLTATFLLDKYLLHSTLLAAMIATTILFVYTVYTFLAKEKKEETERQREFDLPILAKNRDIDDVDHDLYGYRYKYTLDNAIDKIELKNKKIALGLAKEIEKYLNDKKLADSEITKILAKKFEIDIYDEDSLFDAHKKITTKIVDIYKKGGIVRVQQLLQHAKSDEEKAFIYFLSQLGSKKFTPFGAKYAIFAIKHNFLEMRNE